MNYIHVKMKVLLIDSSHGNMFAAQFNIKALKVKITCHVYVFPIFFVLVYSHIVINTYNFNLINEEPKRSILPNLIK